MTKRTDQRSPGEDPSAAELAAWVKGHPGLLRGLAELRELGTQAHDAVAAILDVREVRRVRLSWELREALSAGAGVDPEHVLLRHLPYSRLELARCALWG